jgi:hypothetical protein
MDSNQPATLSPEARFWSWFQDNSGRLMDFEDHLESMVEEVNAELSKVADGLTFQISSKESYGREFIVSADGNRQLFSAVIRLVGAAPSLAGWKVIAFRQPIDSHFSLVFGNYTFLPDNVWFSVSEDVFWLDLTLYIKGLSAQDRKIASYASFIALDNVLGEYDVEMKIGHIDWKPAPKNPIKAGLKPFHELASVVRQWKAPSYLPVPSLRVFLCHSSDDKPAIRKLYQKLKASGFNPWLDEEDILPGQDWQSEITKAVNTTDVILVCLSSGSVTKTGYIQKEIKDVLDVADRQPEDTIFLIPVRLEPCLVPERLSRWQWVNLFDKRGYERLLRALRTRANTLKHSINAQTITRS